MSELLHKAIREGNVNSVNRLLNQGVSVNSMNKKGFTPLMQAIIVARHIPITPSEMQNLNIPRRRHHYNYSQAEKDVLEQYRSRKGYNLVKKLINRGANLNINNRTNRPPRYPALRYALGFSTPEIVKLLLKSGAHVNKNSLIRLSLQPLNKRYLYGVWVSNKMLDIFLKTSVFNNFTRGHSLPKALMMRQTGQR